MCLRLSEKNLVCWIGPQESARAWNNIAQVRQAILKNTLVFMRIKTLSYGGYLFSYPRNSEIRG
jgi:hypothetical protein